MKLKCFITDCLSGDAKIRDLDAYVEYWHKNQPTPTLREFLGLTEFEYSQWGVRSDRIFTEVLYCRKRNIDYQRFLLAHPWPSPRKSTNKACKKVAELSKKCEELTDKIKTLTASNEELNKQNAKLLQVVVDTKNEAERIIKEKTQAIKDAALSNETLAAIGKVLNDKCSYLEKRVAKFAEKVVVHANKPGSSEYQNAKINQDIAKAQLANLKNTIIKVEAAQKEESSKANESLEEMGTPLEQAMEDLFLKAICNNILCGSQRCECTHVWIEGCQRYRNFKADIEKVIKQHLESND